jgi:hypothetical protein
MASDGLWDLMDFDKAAKITRGCGTDGSAQALVTAAANDRRAAGPGLAPAALGRSPARAAPPACWAASRSPHCSRRGLAPRRWAAP